MLCVREQFYWHQGGWSLSPPAQHLGKHTGNISSFPALAGYKLTRKDFQRQGLVLEAPSGTFLSMASELLWKYHWKHVCRNGKMLRDTYICAFKPLWHLWSNFTFQYFCSQASPWSVSLGEALLKTSFTAAILGRIFTKFTGVALSLKIQAIRL